MPRPPASVRRNARKGLELRRKTGKGGTPVGWARARDLKNGRNVSTKTLKRMVSFFARHRHNKNTVAGRSAWLQWGGDAGEAWAKRELRKRTRK